MTAPASQTLLADAERAGLYRMPATGCAPLTTAAAALGFPCLRVDLAGCLDKGCLLDRLARALSFPAWFGRNWDALADCLTDLAWMPAAGYVLVLGLGTAPAASLEADLRTALAVLEDATAYWREQNVPFWVFVDPVGPAAALPCLP